MEQMLEYYNVNVEQRVCLAAMHLKGSPLQWYRWLLRSNKGLLPSWMELERGIISMYGRRSVMEHSGELSKLKQEGADYDRYQKEFMGLSHQIQELPEDYLVGCFISGLRNQVKYEIISDGSNEVGTSGRGKTRSIEEIIEACISEEYKLTYFRWI